jgi:hypothetical protein
MTPDEFIEEFEARMRCAGLRAPEVQAADLSPAGPDEVAFDLIKVALSVRRQGIAKRVLKLLLCLSDETGMPLQVIPCRVGDDGGLSDEALKAWYLENGFVCAPTPDIPRLMRRTPQSPTASASSA